MVIAKDKKGISLSLPQDKDRIAEFIVLIDSCSIERFSIGIERINDPLIDLKFLHRIKNTKFIKEVSLGYCINIDAICRFSEIQSLNVDAVNNEIIDLAYFPKLTKLCTGNISAYKNLSVPKIDKFISADTKFSPNKIEEMTELKTLIFHPLPKGFSFENISKLKKLKRISMTQGSIRNLAGIEVFKNLVNFDIDYVRTLENIDGISALPKLLFIELGNCPKLTNIDEISKIKTLQVLFLKNVKNCDLRFIHNMLQLRCIDLNNCANLDSLDFINEMQYLKTFTFNQTNVLDGNLMPCMRLKFAHTRNKRHYNLKNEQLPHDYDYCLSAYLGFGKFDPCHGCHGDGNFDINH